jgi:hypothetical protein
MIDNNYNKEWEVNVDSNLIPWINKPIENNIKAGIISHHLPAALPLIAGFYKNLKFAYDKIKTFIKLIICLRIL